MVASLKTPELEILKKIPEGRSIMAVGFTLLDLEGKPPADTAHWGTTQAAWMEAESSFAYLSL